MQGIRTAAVLPSVVVLFLLSACGAATPASVPGSLSTNPEFAASAGDEGDPADGYPLPDCTGQDPSDCSYAGFDPDVDGFSFENWGGIGQLGATELIALFGEQAVCAKVEKNGCVLYPAARQWAAQVNESMAGGHCEGMAVMAARLFRGDVRPSDLDPAAGATFGLAQEDPDVQRAIDLWFATQFLAPVQEAYQAFQKYQPSEIAAELAAGLQRGDGYTMGIYSPDGGHAVTPIAVTWEGERIAVSVYDNNFPGTVQRIMIDPAKEYWSYAMGSTNPDAPSGGWEGGVGTIELTPMGSRALPAPAPFADGPSKQSATRELLVTSPDPTARVGFLLTIDGQTYDTTDPTVVLPTGVVARSVLGAVRSGKGMKVTIDKRMVQSFKASPATRQAGAGQPPITMSIDSGGSPRITLRQDAVESREGGAWISMGANGTINLAADDGADAQVNVSNGLNGVDFPLPDGVDMSVDPGERDGVASVEFIGAGANVIGAYEVDDETDSGSVVDSSAVFDATSGDFDVTSQEAEDLNLPEGYEQPEYVDESGSDEPASPDSADDADGEYVEPDIIDDPDQGAPDDSLDEEGDSIPDDGGDSSE